MHTYVWADLLFFMFFIKKKFEKELIGIKTFVFLQRGFRLYSLYIVLYGLPFDKVEVKRI